MAERKRNYELVVALTPVVNEAEAETIVENIMQINVRIILLILNVILIRNIFLEFNNIKIN